MQHTRRQPPPLPNVLHSFSLCSMAADSLTTGPTDKCKLCSAAFYGTQVRHDCVANPCKISDRLVLHDQSEAQATSLTWHTECFQTSHRMQASAAVLLFHCSRNGRAYCERRVRCLRTQASLNCKLVDAKQHNAPLRVLVSE